MRLGRRDFLKALGSAAGFALGGRAEAGTAPGALAVHRATHNTRSGALGVALRDLLPRPRPEKLYPALERRGLPVARPGPSRPLAEVVLGFEADTGLARDGSLGLDELARLLFLANGVTGRLADTALRTAPSAGALYAGEVYVAAERVRDLPAGVYYYGVLDHELVSLGPGSAFADVENALESPDALDGAAAVVLLTSVFGRYAWKYANRGYRYALVDTGHIGENLRLAARASGVGARDALRFRDDALSAILGIDGREEAVCDVHVLGRSGPLRMSSRAPLRPLRERGMGSGPVPAHYHAATALVPAEASRADHSGQGLQPGAAVPKPAGGDVPLPRPEPPRATVEETLRARRSPLSFAHQQISLAALAFVLQIAGREALGRSAGTGIYAVAHRVEGLAPGIYRYVRRSHALDIRRRSDFGDALARVCLGQRMAGDASVALMISGRIREAATRAGERSYRHLLVESGAIAQRIYLAAEALGLRARNLAAFVDDDLNALLGLDGADEAVLHLTLVGRA